MKRLMTTAIIMFAMGTVGAQQQYGEDFALKIWNNDSAPHSNGLSGTEVEEAPHRIAMTTETELFIFAADSDKAADMAVVICPGGGYHRLAMDHEGVAMARWFAQRGITAAVLKYRMPEGHPEVPLEDAEMALRIMKGDAADARDAAAAEAAAKYAAGCVGIAGASAGGHLAAMVSTMGSVRPDFTILFYPVITGETGKCHAGSFDNLLGRNRTAELTAVYSLENQVDDKTPPAILLLSDDDYGVPPVSSVRYYEALKRHGTEASMHIYPSGGHGWGMNENFRYRDQWREALDEWLARRKK